jgi:hypothetical protein
MPMMLAISLLNYVRAARQLKLFGMTNFASAGWLTIYD